MAPRQMGIPQPFNYLLPAQGLVAGVAIYSTIYVFGVGKIPFILTVVAAGLHFLLGIYFCFTKNRLRTHDFYLVPLVLVAGAGVWAGSLYYFAKLLDLLLRLGRIIGTTATTTGQPEIATWTKVGTSMTGLNVFIDIILVIVFIAAALKSNKSTYPQQEPVYNPPSAPAPAPTFPVQPVTVQYQQPQQQYQQQQYYQVQSLPPIQRAQQPPSPQRIVSSTSSDFKLPIASTISPATSPSPSQQYQQYQQPQTAQYQHQRQQSFTSQQTTTPSYPAQYQQQPQVTSSYSHQPPPQPPFAPSPQPPPTPPQPTRPPQPSPSSSPNNSHNRIETLRRLSTLQHPLGNWIYTAELASILQLWGIRHQIISPNTPTYDITVLTHGLMTDLRNYIWTAQNEGRQHSMLSTEELASLRGVNWDLAWVGMGIDRAGGWLSQAQGQIQGQGQTQNYGGGGGYR